MSRPWLVLALALALACAGAMAREAVPAAEDPALEVRVLRITGELRCLVCQNQTIADSHSGLAEDLRREVRDQLRRGASDEQVVQFMTDRYGDFVRYRPPFRPATALLWLGPALLLVGGLGSFAVVLRRRHRMAPDRFEPDVEEPDAGAEAAVSSPIKGPSR